MADIQHLCALIEAAPLDPGAWTTALDTLAGALGGWGGQMIGFSGEGRFPFFITGGVAPEIPADYDARGGADPAVNPRAALAWSAPPLEVVTDAGVVSEETRRRNPIYQEFLEPLDSHFVSAAVLEASPALRVVTAVCHTKTQGPPQAHQRELYAALLPRLAAAARLQMRLETEAADLALGMLGSLGLAAVLCDFQGRIVRLSPIAERMLSEGRLITSRGGRLRGVSADSDTRLSAAVDRALALTSLRTPRSSAVLLRSVDGADLRVADVTPLPATAESFRTGARVLVAVGAASPRAQDLLAQLGLTPAESEVARALAAGARLPDIAERRGVAVDTVRAQLKSVYGKLGVRRQAELVKRMRDLT